MTASKIRFPGIKQRTDFYTVIAYTAMGTSRWPIEFAGDAPFHPYCDAVYFDRFI